MTIAIPVTGEFLRDQMGARCAAYLRLHYREPRAKLIARDFKCSPEAVKPWLAGRLPQNKFLALMMHAFGPGFAAVVLEPCGAWAGALAVEADIAELRTRLGRLQDDLETMDRVRRDRRT